MKHNIRILSFVLSVFMLFACLPGYAYASDTESPEAFAEETVEETAIPQTKITGEEHISTEPMGTEEPNSVASTTIANGVYAFLSAATVNQWITVENGSPWAGNNLRNEYSTTTPTTNFVRASLFKISQVGSTGRYIIRSMVNNNLSFGVSGGEIITKTIPSNDAAVDDDDTFYIEAIGSYYYIRPYDENLVINIPSATGGEINAGSPSVTDENTSTASVSHGTDADINAIPDPSAANGNLNVVSKSSATISAQWILRSYTGSHQSGISLYRPSAWGSTGQIVGNTSEATPIGWSTYINANTLFAEIPSNQWELGTLYWNSSENLFSLVAKNPGQIRIDCSIKYANGNVAYSGYFTHMIVPKAKTYYLENAGTGRFVDIEGPSRTAGAYIQQWDYHGADQGKWIVEHVPNSGGYIRLKSVYSGLYIGVDSANTSLIKQYSTQNNYTLWKMSKKENRGYTFTCKATESTGLALAIPLNANANGTNLTQVSYTDNTNYRDEWYLISETMNIEFSFDQSFLAKYQVEGESTANAVLRVFDDTIYNYYLRVRNAFLTKFHLDMVDQSVNLLYTSDADLCNSDVSAHCECLESDTDCTLTSGHDPYRNNNIAGFEHAVHCKSFIRLRNNLINNISANTIHITYTAHDLCLYDPYHPFDNLGNPISPHHYRTEGLSDFAYPIICINEHNEIMGGELKLAHEIAHYFGAVHHENSENVFCVMHPTKYTINVFDPAAYFCSDCVIRMKGNMHK